MNDEFDLYDMHEENNLEQVIDYEPFDIFTIGETEILDETQYLDFNVTEYENHKDDKKLWTWVHYKKKIVMVAAYISCEKKKAFLFPNTNTTEERKIIITTDLKPSLEDYEYSFPTIFLDSDECIDEEVFDKFKRLTGTNIKRVIRKSPFVTTSSEFSDHMISIWFVEAENEYDVNRDMNLYTKDNVQDLLQNVQSEKINSHAWLILDKFERTNSL